MKRQVYFCKSWFRARKIATDVWSEEEARKVHDVKGSYTVLVDSIERPFCFLNIAEGVVVVGFLDDLLREAMTYAFQEVSPERLFLSMAVHREFVNETDSVRAATTYIFRQDGSVSVLADEVEPRSVVETQSSVDVSPNYSAAPQFGEYEDLIRVERSSSSTA